MTQAPRHEPLGSGPFAKTHAGFSDMDDIAWADLDAGRYDERTRERGRRSFILRALDEQRSLLAFSELLGELCEAGAPIDVIGSLTRVVRDEARHVDYCDRVVKSLGGWDPKAPQPRWVRSNKKLPLKRRILTTVLGSLCVGETISVHMIAGVREHTTDPVVAEVMTALLRDESFHSRFGWWWLEAMPLSDEDHVYARKLIERVFVSLSKNVRPKPEKLGTPHTYSPFGSMSADERDAAFVKAMEKTIVPGFDAAGLEASAIWKRVQGTA